MRLDLANFRVRDIAFSDVTRYADGVLYVNEEVVRDLVLQDDMFTGVQLAVARPGEKTRIINTVDVVEPRHKVSGNGTVFPGTLGPPLTGGNGRLHCLKGLALVATSPPAPGDSTHWRDSVIDMWGEGAGYTPFSSTINLAVQLEGRADFTQVESVYQEKANFIRGSRYAQKYNLAARMAMFKVADYLASTTRGLHPDDVEVHELTRADPSLPKVAYTFQVLYQWLYGRQVGWQPTLLHPNEMLDGAMFSSFMGIPSGRDTTFIYQNHPVVRDLYRRHGIEVDFQGILLYLNGGTALVEKETTTEYAVKLLKMLGTDGVVMTWNGGGHPGIDIMMLCQKCERAGIKTTLLNPEMARARDDTGFVHFVPEADAIVSTGNYEMELTLPAAEEVIGGSRLLVPEADARGPLTLPLRYILGQPILLGWRRSAGSRTEPR